MSTTTTIPTLPAIWTIKHAYLDKQFRFGTGGIMTMRKYLGSKVLTRKSVYIRHFARKRVCLEYKRLATPATEYTVWYIDPEHGELGLQIPKGLYALLDLPVKHYEEPH